MYNAHVQKDVIVCSVGICSQLSYVRVAQLVERGTHKPKVAGSIPASDTTDNKRILP